MIDAALLRTAPDRVKSSQAARGESVELVDEALAADTSRRAALAAFETLRAEQNAHAKLVGRAPAEERGALLAAAQELAAKVKSAEQAARDAEETFTALAGQLGNVIIDGVPVGGEDNWALVREVGQPSRFDFAPRDHAEIGELTGTIDIARGTKVSGSRFYFLRGWGARLELALMQLGLGVAVDAGFTPLITPTLVKPEVMRGTGFLGAHSDEIYYLPADELYLTGTSEVALAGYHADEILDVTEPIRYAGWSACYRREAGAAGKDNRGILRVHQFHKLEMFSYAHPDQAEAEHLELLAMQERMLQACELNYRVIDVAAGDLGSSAARKYDIEAWVPTQGTYRELTSTSNCTTFQARRLGTRYRGDDGRTHPVATLNGTLATTRWLVAILETHQQADGSVRVPAALQAHLGTDVIPLVS